MSANDPMSLGQLSDSYVQAARVALNRNGACNPEIRIVTSGRSFRRQIGEFTLMSSPSSRDSAKNCNGRTFAAHRGRRRGDRAVVGENFAETEAEFAATVDLSNGSHDCGVDLIVWKKIAEIIIRSPSECYSRVRAVYLRFGLNSFFFLETR